MTTPIGGTGPGSEPADMRGSNVPREMGAIVKRVGKHGTSRSKLSRESRRAAQFAKFRLAELNLVPLVDCLVSIVFFALTTAVVGELTAVSKGVTLPESSVGAIALKEVTVAVGSQLAVGGRPIMSIQDAAASKSNNPAQPLLIPELYAALKASADSIRQETKTGANQSITTKLAIQGDKTMRYDLLSRVLMSARMAGFRNVSLQVQRTGTLNGAPVALDGTAAPTQASID